MKKLVSDLNKITAPALDPFTAPAADSWRVQVNRQAGTVRVSMLDHKTKKVLSVYESKAEDAYTLAQRILQAYDVIEGI